MKWNKTIFKSDYVEVKRHVRGQYDAFFGQGFVEWVRFKVNLNLAANKKSIEQVAGKPLTKQQRALLVECV